MATSLFGVRVVFAPGSGVTAVAFILAGVTVGTLSGLLPGLHVNALAMLLAIAAPSIPAPPHLLGATMLAAGVTHSFLDIVPSLTLGVPDAAMATTALPGHRLVLGGRGHEALRLSVIGSTGAVGIALLLGWPVTKVMVRVYPVLRDHLPVVLALVMVLLLLRERTRRAVAGGILALVASGGLGIVILDSNPVGVLPVSEVLLPAFAGLFGVPILLTALRGRGVPEQDDALLAIRPRMAGRSALAGAGAGGIVGYIPGVSTAIAAVLALLAIRGTGAPGSKTDGPGGGTSGPSGKTGAPGSDSSEPGSGIEGPEGGTAPRGDRQFVVAVSGVNTSNTIFALFALLALGSPRTGVLVAYEHASLPLNLPLLLASIVIAGATSAILVIVLGDPALRLARRIDNHHLVTAVIALLVCLSVLFAGPYGILVLVVATLIGFIPQIFGARRVHLMGILVVPLATGL